MAVTDLTNTKWRFGEYINSNYTNTFNYSINFNLYIASNNTDNDRSMTNFILTSITGNYNVFDYQVNGQSGFYYGYNNRPRIKSNYRDGFEYLEITILGGADATNTNLIAWLEANATQIIDEPTEPTDSPTAVITYNGKTTEVAAGKTATLACNGKKAITAIAVKFTGAGTITYKGYTTELEAGKTATLQCAGKKMTGDVYVTVEGKEKKLVDLTGATVTIHHQIWSASAGYGLFNVNFDYSTPIIDYKVYYLGIGYNSELVATENAFTFRNSSNANIVWVTNTGSKDYTIKITGGTDATNQDLIQWFLDNNATIEGGVWE